MPSNGILHALQGLFAAHQAGKVGAAAGGALLAGQSNAQRVEQPAVLFAQFFGREKTLQRVQDAIAKLNG